jgi:kumamolisin
VTEPRPAWQTGPGVPAGVNRPVPDISMHYGTCTTEHRQVFSPPPVRSSGWCRARRPTHLSGRAAGGESGDGALGQAAPTLWRILRSEGGTSYATSFHDITTGNNGAFAAGAGFDAVTGIGSPRFNNIYPALSLLTGSGVLQGTVTAGGFPASGATVTASGFAGNYSATANGSGVYQFASLPAGSFTVTAAAGGFATACRPRA